ncbi:hypothetical protein NKG05_21765 [Oerskovia sp. M15]
MARAGIETPRVDAELLLAHAAGVPREGSSPRPCSDDRSPRCCSRPGPTGGARAVGGEVLDDLARLLDARAERVPLQHLTGTAPFRHLELVVGAGCSSRAPRPSRWPRSGSTRPSPSSRVGPVRRSSSWTCAPAREPSPSRSRPRSRARGCTRSSWTGTPMPGPSAT